MNNSNQPILNATQRVLLKKASLHKLLSLVDALAGSLDNFVDKMIQDQIHTDLWKQNAISEAAAEALQRMDNLTVAEMRPINDVTERQRKQLQAELELKGGLDAIILQNAMQMLLSEKLNVLQIIATDDPDLLRAALILPSGKHLVLKGDPKKVEIIETALAKHMLGEDGYAEFVTNDRKLNVLRDLRTHFEKLQAEFGNKSVGIKKQLRGAA